MTGNITEVGHLFWPMGVLCKVDAWFLRVSNLIGDIELYMYGTAAKPNDHLSFSSVYTAGKKFARRRFAPLLVILSNLCHLDLSLGMSVFWSSFILFVLSGLWLLEMKIINIVNSVEFCLVPLTSLCLFCSMADYISRRSNIVSIRPCSSEPKIK